MQIVKHPLSWRECEFVSMANAARIVGRAPSWVRGALCTGNLVGVNLPTGGPPVVTVESLVALLDAVGPAEITRAAGGRSGAVLRLVASNS